MAAKALALALVLCALGLSDATVRVSVPVGRRVPRQCVLLSYPRFRMRTRAARVETSVCCLRLDARGRSKRVSPVARPGPIA